MKTLLCISSLLVSLWSQTAFSQAEHADPSLSGRSRWVALNAGILTQTTPVRLIMPGTTPGTVYAESGLGLIRSDDSGATWRQLPNLPTVEALASGGAQVLYAATIKGFYRSLDGGDTWTAGGSDLSFAYITADPSNPATVYGSYGGDVYKSADQGATWSIFHSFGSPVAIGGGAVITGWIGVDPKNSSVIYVSLQLGGTVFKSIDGGKSWSTILPASSAGFGPLSASLAIDPQNSSDLYGGSFTTVPSTPPANGSSLVGGISKSTDGGQTWKKIQNGFPAASSVINIVIDPANPNHLFASFIMIGSGGGGLISSSDAGETWSQVYSVNDGAQGETVFYLGTAPGVVYASYYDGSLPRGGVIVSIDGGATWKDANRGLAYYDLHTFAAASSPNVLYTGGSQGLFKSTDSGADWSLLSTPSVPSIGGFPGGGAVANVVADPAEPNTVYSIFFAPSGCDYLQQNLFKSTDGGQTWNNISPPDTGCMLPWSFLKVDPANSQTIYLALDDFLDDGFALTKSTDGGATWNRLWVPGSSVIGALAFDPSNSSTIYAGLEGLSPGDEAGLFKSVDGGVTWNATGPLNATLVALAVDPFNAMNLYAAESQSVLASADGGVTWSNANAGLQGIAGTGAAITSLVADPKNKGVLYIGTSGAGTFRSADGGQNWSRITARPAESNVRQLSIVSGSVYAVTTGGVLKLTDR